ncbi:MAG: lysophospholipid acyltransferase family protein [Actinomycetota bacterium]|nr:1-acyl-sn-glycerol-3-phosphate acyltransferase [Actinomycetota bacterium]
MGLETGYSLARAVLLPWLGSFRNHIEGIENVPEDSAAIVAVNHISLFDPLAVAYALDRYGRRPRFFAKSSLFKAPFVGWVLRTARQIRVDRGSPSAPGSLGHGESAIRDGQVVVIFPEGTTTTAPDLAPLTPKTGVARLALATKTDIIPCATWGGQWVWSYHAGFHPSPRKDIWVRFGSPISVEMFSGRHDDPEAWDELSALVMQEIAVLLAGLKVAKPWTPRPIRRSVARRKGEA